jgi:hypothetical protein
MEVGAAGEVGIDGEDGSTVSFEEGVSVGQLAEDFARMGAQVGLVLSLLKGVFSCTLNVCGMSEQGFVASFGDGDVRSVDGTVLTCPRVDGEEEPSVNFKKMLVLKDRWGLKEKERW